MAGVGAPVRRSPINMGPRPKISRDFLTYPLKIAKNLHAGPNRWETDKIFGLILIKMFFVALFASWGGKIATFWKKSSPHELFWNFFTFFQKKLWSSTGRGVIPRNEVRSHRSQKFSKNHNFWLFLHFFWIFSQMVDFWIVTSMIKVVCRR